MAGKDSSENFDFQTGTETQKIALRPEVTPIESCRVKGYDYRLPSLAPGGRVLFLGDSITDMKWGRNESDRNHYLGHSYVFLLAARLGVDMPEKKLEFFNRGHSGNTVADLSDRWEPDAIDLKPDLLSILVGTNDVGKGVPTQAFETDYRRLLQTSRDANPALQLVLIDPFVLKAGKLKDDSVYTARRAATDELCLVVAQLAREFNAVHVKMQEVFDCAAEKSGPDHWLWDGVHPLPQGHELIARTWLRSVSARWPEA